MRARSLVGLCLVAMLGIAACGSSGSSSNGTNTNPPGPANSTSPSKGGGKVEELKVGIIPAVFVAPVYIGIEQGFFADEGLSIKPEMAQGGAAIVTGVVGGSYDVGFSDVVSLIQAGDNGLPVELLANGNLSDKDPAHPFSAITVLKDSPIKSAKDLEGKKVAVNVLKNSGELTIKTVVEKAGGDPSKINFVELPFPDMTAALVAGNVDAIWSVEPFLTLGADKLRVLFPNYSETDPNMTVSAYFTKKDRAGSETMEKFKRAINKANEYAQANPDAIRAAVGSFLKLPAAVTGKIGLPGFSGTLDMDNIEKTAGIIAHLGFTKSTFDVSKINTKP